MKYILKTSLIMFALLLIFNISSVWAQSKIPADSSNTSPKSDSSNRSPSNNTPVTPLQNPINADNIEQLLLKVVDIAIFVGSLIAVLMFLVVGFKFVMAQGNPKEIEEAKKWFFYAIIGTVILISSKVIVEVIQNTLTSSGIVNEKLFKK